MSKNSADMIEALRPKFNFDDGTDVAAWDYLNQIAKVPVEALFNQMVEEMKLELVDLEEQIQTFERQRLTHLNNKALRKQAQEIIASLRKEYDGLKRTLGSETYKRLGSSGGKGAVQSGRSSAVVDNHSSRVQPQDLGNKT